MDEKQKTIKQECAIFGIGLHTGNRVNIKLKPSRENCGIRFIRTDLPARPIIEANLSNVLTDGGTPRCTSLGRDGVVINTVEHLMSVLSGLGIDNLDIEIDSNELPGLDGSGFEFLQAILQAGLEEQNAPRAHFSIIEPIGVSQDAASIYLVPDSEFRVSYVLDYGHPLVSSQFFSATVNRDVFEREIVPCRTFCLETEAKQLRDKGLGKGADYRNTLVLGERGIINNKVKFENEFARHKVFDFIGDLYLLGMPIKGHAFATKSGHKLNLALLRKIHQQKIKQETKGFVPATKWGDQKVFGIDDIMKILPHRYPFLLVDRIVEMEKGKSAVGIKNVTINDNFFQGHFPTKPVMPGVLMVEAMAQTAGVVALTSENHHGKVALFMSTDAVKFRKIVVPGDQLHFYVEVVSDKSRSSKFHGTAKVGEDVVAEADIVFSYMDASFLSS
ncbi:MAG: UDP-3-O-acyl-N-acetylglucosamine deacetylase [Candidatus Omnitrophota bacterium]